MKRDVSVYIFGRVILVSILLCGLVWYAAVIAIGAKIVKAALGW